MKEEIEKIKSEVAAFVISAKDSLEEYRLKFLSKNGSVSKLFENFRNMAGEEKNQWARY